jgi:hypothetical protein
MELSSALDIHNSSRKRFNEAYSLMEERFIGFASSVGPYLKSSVVPYLRKNQYKIEICFLVLAAQPLPGPPDMNVDFVKFLGNGELTFRAVINGIHYFIPALAQFYLANPRNLF